MKEFACGDVVPNCTTRFRCSTEEELLRHVAQHARQAHGLDDIPASLVDQVRARIVTVE